MPPGALWCLHYQNTNEDQVQVFLDQALFDRDEYVLLTVLHRTGGLVDSLLVQMIDDCEAPRAPSLSSSHITDRMRILTSDELLLLGEPPLAPALVPIDPILQELSTPSGRERFVDIALGVIDSSLGSSISRKEVQRSQVPLWVQEGRWVRHGQETAQIKKVGRTSVRIRSHTSNKTRWVPTPSFLNQFVPCSEPKAPVSRFERVLSDFDLDNE